MISDILIQTKQRIINFYFVTELSFYVNRILILDQRYIFIIYFIIFLDIRINVMQFKRQYTVTCANLLQINEETNNDGDATVDNLI